jgi:hypothetical protein
MDGQVLSQIISEDFLNANPVRFAAQSIADDISEVELSAEENADVIERLKSLGYMG